MSFSLHDTLSSVSGLAGTTGLTGLGGLGGLGGGPLGGGAMTDFLKGQQTPQSQDLLALLMQLLPHLPQLMAMMGAAPAGAAPAGAAPAGAAPAGGGHGAAAAGGAKDKGPTVKADGPGGFLWKPVSDSNGKLAVLLPPKLAGKVSGVEIQDAQGKTIGTGKFSANANGGRDHFRFDKPGAEYGSNVTVVATLKNGEKVSFPIENGAVRND